MILNKFEGLLFWGEPFFVYLQKREILESKNLHNFCNLMKIKTLLVGLTIPLTGFAQSFQVVPQELPNPDNVPAPCHPVPHKRQILWNETEFYAIDRRL